MLFGLSIFVAVVRGKGGCFDRLLSLLLLLLLACYSRVDCCC